MNFDFMLKSKDFFRLSLEGKKYYLQKIDCLKSNDPNKTKKIFNRIINYFKESLKGPHWFVLVQKIQTKLKFWKIKQFLQNEEIQPIIIFEPLLEMILLVLLISEEIPEFFPGKINGNGRAKVHWHN